jgi:copper(I)-binding protein
MKGGVHLIAALVLALYIGGETHAQTTAAAAIIIEQPWARATPKGAKTGAVYMTLVNNGTSSDRLLGATTPLADKVQFHQETEDNGVSRMREVHNVALEPGAKVIFKPGEIHMMIVGLKQPLKEGQSFPLALQFEKAGNVDVTVAIEKVGAMQHENTGTMKHGPDDGMKE